MATATPHTLASDTAGTLTTDQQVSLEGLVPGPLPTLVITTRDDLVAVAPPCVGGVAIPLPLERALLITFRSHGVPCQIPAVLVQAPSSSSDCYWARVTGPLVRNQRRKDVRVPVVIPVMLRPEEPLTDVDQVPASTVDASLGGLQLTSPHEFAVYDRLGLTLDLSGVTVTAVGEVVRSSADAKGRSWQLGVRFLDMTGPDRRRLMDFLLDRQRALRRRELGLE
jgi:PilZ domain